MSSSIWTQCAVTSRRRALAAEAWRVVEAQHVVSTRKLVDSDAEQGVLEDLLEQSKPPLEPALGALHYLLFTPFRYPPLRHGSRFGTRMERGIFYASLSPRTAFAEVAYYRLLFLEASAADLAPLYVDLTLFSVQVADPGGVDLTAAPFSAFAPKIAAEDSYAWSQPLGAAMRAAGVRAFLYPSARDPGRGVNLGVFDPSAFLAPQPTASQAWLCAVSATAVEVQRRDPLAPRAVHRFERKAFGRDGCLPSPGA